MKNSSHKNYCLFFLFFITQLSFSQLANFSLVVTKTDESCTGNGALFFNVQQQTSGSTIIYSIYNLPNVTTPISVLSTNTFTGLSAGNYRVVATQTLGNLSNSQQQDIQILDIREDLTYQLSSEQTNCATGSIIVTVLTGSPLTYEIISGPIIVLPQASNVFTNLTSGVYTIRVNDICGDGVTQSFTLSFTNLPNLDYSEFVSLCQLETCDAINGFFTILANTNTSIRYPLSIQTTTFPPSGGSSIVQTQTVNSGNPNQQPIFVTLPFYHAENYTVSIQITDGCGINYTNNAIEIQEQLTVSAGQLFSNCLSKLEISVCNFLPPYSLNFISSPSGFNPIVFNSNHPGPFNSGITSYQSIDTNELPLGNYVIEVVDACGRMAQTQVEVKENEPGFDVSPFLESCENAGLVTIPDEAGVNVTSVIITNGPAILNQNFPYDVSFNINSGIFQMQLPIGTYVFTGTDVCGNDFEYEIIIIERIVTISAIGNSFPGCTSNNGSIEVTSSGTTITGIQILQAPLSFNQTLPYTFPLSNTNSVNVMIPNLPAGSYTLVVTDICNNNHTITATIANEASNAPLILLDRKGCGNGMDSISFFSVNGLLQEVIIISAPTAFPFSLPYDASFNIAQNGVFYMNSLPEGTYQFYTKDICNVERTETRLLSGYYTTSDTVQFEGNCGSFNLLLNYNSNVFYPTEFWLQKYNAATNQWMHPLTNVVYDGNSFPNASNSLSLINNTTNFNINSFGQFRVLQTFDYYSNGISTFSKCIETIKDFEYNGGIEITAAYALQCTTQETQIVVIANGIGPLNYQITTKNGLPFTVNNGTSNIFSGLEPGIYNFRVEDACGNIVNRLLDIATLPEPSIAPTNLCENQMGSLSVQPFSFLNYQWWKDANTSTILSTSNVLTFNPFVSSLAAGTYYVRIYSSIPGSCVDKIISYTIPLNAVPNAGQDGNLNICGSSSSIDLFTVLNGTFDTGGIWEETTNSGMLSGYFWLPVGIPYGNYSFKYKVDGFCNSFDESIITINYNQTPTTPVITLESNNCNGDSVQFFVEPIPNATYNWSGPNNFNATTQNLFFENATDSLNGIYFLTVNVNGCEATSSVEISLKPIPVYSLEQSCINNVYTITAVSDSVTNSDSFLWSGPNGFSSSNNPILITNSPKGIYSVVITNNEGCETTETINVENTLCTITNGISPNGDGSNDSFDLSGFTGVKEVKIYNRYGMLVFEHSEYTNQWHGQQKNSEELLPSGTYYYLVNFENEAPKTGWVYLSRD